ncbi:unnamed protein product [Mytilus coruscus]|uniref:Uncharacterized protein n=1 Tax=Mytilus coruscus TaxID=42192 RepID=A0A6J8B684_MYTCO|nr:unnamed protein product [Mytilus coruscus]
MYRKTPLCCLVNSRMFFIYQEKKYAWKKVENAVNAVSFTIRTTEEINIKRGAKKKATTITNERKKTGEVPRFIELSKMEENVVAVVGEERVFGISTGCDPMKTPIKALCAEINTVVSTSTPQFVNTTENILSVIDARPTPKSQENMLHPKTTYQ